MIYISNTQNKTVYIELIEQVEKFEVLGSFGISFILKHHNIAMWLYKETQARDQEFHEVNNIWSNYQKEKKLKPLY